MTSLILVVGLTLIAGIAVVLLLASKRADDFHLTRSTTINAPADKIHPLIANLRNMNQWNPFAHQDPTMRIVYSGPESGTGARHDWTADGRGGDGDLEIIDTTPTAITMRLHMLKPMEVTNTVVFGLEPKGDATEVSWSMSGKVPCYMAKVLHTVFNMDKMVGGTFAKGLADLKAIAER